MVLDLIPDLDHSFAVFKLFTSRVNFLPVSLFYLILYIPSKKNFYGLMSAISLSVNLSISPSRIELSFLGYIGVCKFFWYVAGLGRVNSDTGNLVRMNSRCVEDNKQTPCITEPADVTAYIKGK